MGVGVGGSGAGRGGGGGRCNGVPVSWLKKQFWPSLPLNSAD